MENKLAERLKVVRRSETDYFVLFSYEYFYEYYLYLVVI